MIRKTFLAVLAFVSVHGGTLFAGIEVCGAGWRHSLKCRDWTSGGAEWQSFDVTPEIVDWRGYDRFSVKVAYEGPAKGSVSVYVGGKGPHQYETLPLPPCRWRRWTFRIKLPPKLDPASVKTLHFYTTRPRGGVIHFEDARLLKPGEPVPVCDPAEDAMFVDSLRRMLAEQTAGRESLSGEFAELKAHMTSFLEFRDACEAAGQTGGMLLGKATTMERIRPRAALDRPLAPADALSVRLARREYEGIQLIVAPRSGPLTDVAVSVGELRTDAGDRLPASDVLVAVTGYMKIGSSSPYKVGRNERRGGDYVRRSVRPEKGWYPEPILAYTNATSVAATDMQSFWIRFHAGADQAPGVYRGYVTVSAAGETPRRIPLAVRIDPFTLPVAPPLPTAISWGPEYHPPTADDKDFHRTIDSPRTPVRLWRKHKRLWVDFLADYYITMDGIYKWRDRNMDLETFRRLKERGVLGPVNIGFWRLFKKPSEEAAWRADTLGRLKGRYAQLKAAGLADHAYAYGCDEVPEQSLPLMKRAVEILKKELPGVPLATTAYDAKYGVGSPLEKVDWFIPLTSKYDMKQAEASRRAGHKVWWYICCIPNAPYANMFVDSQAIETRLLHGAMAVKMRPDGFLIYEISIWNAKRGISGGPFTDWNPRTWRNYNGDGCWTCTDGDGRPLPTIRLENYRDGVEDHAYAKLLAERLAAHGGKDDAWSRAAREVLDVPAHVMKSMSDFTDDPAAVYAWRNRLADLILGSPVRRTR